jgi:purine-nucleoside phosphorylase
MRKEVVNAVRFIKQRVNISPKIALILGSGLGDFADTFDEPVKIPTNEIPHFPVSTVEGHKGFLVFGFHNNIPVMGVQGRTHYYEGYTISKVSFVVEIMSAMGISFLLITNAAGSTNNRIKPGDLMLITDQVNFLFDSPLKGNHHFTDMSNPYSTQLNRKIENVALDKGILLKKGVLWTSSGPTYETSAEVKMISKFGGDAVSMSTVPEVIMANRLNLKTVGISCITNYATGISAEKLSHDEVTETANRVKQQFISLVSLIISDIFSN